jgi:copper chaperone CopZ
METLQTVLNVQGMTCGSCARRVDGIIRAFAGVKDVAVNLTAATVTVQHERERPDVSELINAVKHAGWRAYPVPPSAP